VADILDRVIAHERDRAGGFVDLDLDHVAAVRKGTLPAVEGAAVRHPLASGVFGEIKYAADFRN
jgi:predicted lipoprotein